MKGGARKKLIGLFEKVKGSTIGKATFFTESPLGRLRAVKPKRDPSKKRARDVRIQRKVLARMGVPTKQANNVIWWYRLRRISEIATSGGICTSNAGKVILDFMKQNKSAYFAGMKFKTITEKRQMLQSINGAIAILEENIEKNYHFYRDEIAQGIGTKEILQEQIEHEQMLAEFNERLVVKRPKLNSPVIMVLPSVFLLAADMANFRIKQVLEKKQSFFEEQVAKEHEAFERMRDMPSVN
ncbi:MAG: hypothetical protein WCW44_00010 [archaeon]